MSFSEKITNWYLQHKRPLPWRENTNPYSTWLSEIILQQTRVSQGLPYYYAFINSFPTISDLAKANEDQVLKIWQGLGYYSRARNMHKTAQTIESNWHGKFPDTYKDLITLKGIGPYTAAAIASICYEENIAVVDGNVYRVLSRYFDIQTPIDTTAGKKYFNTLANELLTHSKPSIHNQAIMELGALICTPKKTQCNDCPLQSSCLGFSNNTFQHLPQKSKKLAIKNRYFNYIIVIDTNKNTLIQKRQHKDIWQGLFEFPMIETNEPKIGIENIINSIKKHMTIDPNKIINLNLTLTPPKHKLSHQHIHAAFYTLMVNDIDPIKSSNSIKINLKSIEKYAVPQLIQNYLNYEFEKLLSL